MSQRRRQGGFTLLEILVAFVIMAMSLTVLFRTSGGSVRAVADAERYERAVRVARSALASFAAVPESGVHQDGEDGGVRWALRSSPYPLPAGGAGPAVPLHRLEVEVVFDGAGRQTSVLLATLLPQQKPAVTDAK